MRLIKIFTISVLVCLSAVVLLYYVFQHGYKRFYSFEHAHFQEIFSGKKDYDILFIGSSRAYHSIKPNIIDSIMHLGSYNASYAAATLVEMNLFFEAYIKSHKPPRVLVLDLAKTSFDIKDRLLFHSNVYYSFLNNDIVFNTLKRYKPSITIYRYLPFTRFKLADDMTKQNALLGYFGSRSTSINDTYKGYLKRGVDTIKLPFKRYYPIQIERIELEAVDILERLIQTCKTNDIKLIITYAPVYKLKDEKNPNFFPTIQALCNKYNLPFLNYREHPIGDQHTLFSEEYHLNDHGASVFSELIAHDLNRELQPQK